MKEVELVDVLRAGSAVRYGKKSGIVVGGLMCVTSGIVKAYVQAPRGVTSMEFCGENDFFGDWALADASGASCGADAFTDVALLSWSVEEVLRQAAADPVVGRALVRMLAGKANFLRQRAQSMAGENTEGRLSAALAWLDARFGRHVDGSACREMPPFPHRVLAEYVGTTREIVSHYMGKMRRSGLIEYTRNGPRAARIVVKPAFGRAAV